MSVGSTWVCNSLVHSKVFWEYLHQYQRGGPVHHQGKADGQGEVECS